MSRSGALLLIPPSGGETLIAGNTSPGSADGVGTAALFNKPSGIAADAAGNIYVADTGNNAIRKVTPLGVVSTLAGLTQGSADGVGVAAQFNGPTAVAVDNSGNVFVADAGNNELREVSPGGVTTTLLSGSTFTFANPESGPDCAFIFEVTGVAVDGHGTLYAGVAVYVPFARGLYPSYSVSVLRVSGPGVFSVLFQVPDGAGSSLTGGDGAMAIDSMGNIFVFSGDSLFEGANEIATINRSITPNPAAGIAVDANGLIYFGNATLNGVVVVVPVGSVPNIATQPIGATIAYGASTTLSITSSGIPSPSYQWQVDGASIPGATSATYTTTEPGTYSVVVSNTAGSVTSAPAVIVAANRLANISSRALVGTNSNLEIAGFVVSGPPGSTEPVLVRGVGPTLAQFGVAGFLAQPILTLYDSKGNQIATNTKWNTASNASAIATAISSTGAFSFPLDSADSALLVNLAPGAYTAEISGANSSTGVALAEVYEESAGDRELINISRPGRLWAPGQMWRSQDSSLRVPSRPRFWSAQSDRH